MEGNNTIINSDLKTRGPKQYDLKERTLQFAESVRSLIRQLTRTFSNIEDSKQLIRSSGSIGANYIEANEALTKRDFIYKINISRKEAKESRYWLRLINIDNNQLLEKQKLNLLREATELMNIFGSIIRKLR